MLNKIIVIWPINTIFDGNVYIISWPSSIIVTNPNTLSIAFPWCLTFFYFMWSLHQIYLKLVVYGSTLSLAEPYCKSLIIYDMTRKSSLYLILHLRYSESVILFAQSCDVDFLCNAWKSGRVKFVVCVINSKTTL